MTIITLTWAKAMPQFITVEVRSKGNAVCHEKLLCFPC